MTGNGTPENNVKYKTSDGFVYDKYDDAVAHNVVNSRYTSAGSYIETINEEFHPYYY